MQRCILAILSLAFCAGAQAVSEDVQLNLVTTQGVGQTIGSVKITETDRGLEFAPTLRALPPGKHGFHIHAEGSCQPAMKEGKAVAAGAAGGHYDPQHTGKHEGPLGAGHLGDLPLLVVNDAGVADQPTQAESLTTCRSYFDRNLIGCATDTTGLDLQSGHDVVHSFGKCIKGLLTGLILDDIESIVNDLLSNTLLAVEHNAVDELGHQDAVIHRIGQDFSFGNITSSGHVASLLH